MADRIIRHETIFSADRIYRYTLWREWLIGDGYVMFIGLNPSTADEQRNDPTIRRCISYAQAWGFRGFCMTNLFAFRATDPKEMMCCPEPIGPYNDQHLLEVGKYASTIVAAWGIHGSHLNRDQEVRKLFPGLQCLGVTSLNQPRHPLYVKASQPLLPYNLK